MLVVDKPAGVACVGELEAGVEADAAGDGLEERLRAHGLGSVVAEHPLPARASGITLVVRRGSEHTAAVAPWPKLEFVYVVGLDEFEQQRRALEAVGDGKQLLHRVLQRRGARVLLELAGRLPPDGVLSCLRRAGIKVVGDLAQGAAAATRLLLHASQVKGPIAARAPMPGEFDSWLAGEAAPDPNRFAELLAQAGPVRASLWPALEVFRLIGEDAGEIAGVTVDRHGPYAVLSLSTEAARVLEQPIAECLMDHGAEAVYVKRRVRADLRRVDREELWPAAPLRGAPAPASLALSVGRFRFWVRLGEGASTGLFIDQRANWIRLSNAIAGCSLLNLFSYTGAFSVAAALGGARESTSVDLSRRALTNAHANLELNGVAGPQHRLLRADAVDWLRRAERAGRRFDWIVLDPPSFGTREKKGVLDTERDYAGWLGRALALLAPRGRLLAVSHHKRLGTRELFELCARACRELGRSVRLSPWLGAWDCPTLPGPFGAKSVLASLDEP